MKDLMKMMKQAQELQSRMQIEGQAGAGAVRVTLNGKGEMRALRIDPSLMKPGEAEIVEDLVLAAFQDAKAKVEAQMQEKMQDIAGGLPLPPGLKLF